HLRRNACVSARCGSRAGAGSASIRSTTVAMTAASARRTPPPEIMVVVFQIAHMVFQLYPLAPFDRDPQRSARGASHRDREIEFAGERGASAPWWGRGLWQIQASDTASANVPRLASSAGALVTRLDVTFCKLLPESARRKRTSN